MTQQKINNTRFTFTIFHEWMDWLHHKIHKANHKSIYFDSNLKNSTTNIIKNIMGWGGSGPTTQTVPQARNIQIIETVKQGVSKSPLILYGLLVVAVLLVIVGLYLFWRRRRLLSSSNNTQKNNKNITGTKTSTLELIPISDSSINNRTTKYNSSKSENV